MSSPGRNKFLNKKYSALNELDQNHYKDPEDFHFMERKNLKSNDLFPSKLDGQVLKSVRKSYKESKSNMEKIIANTNVNSEDLKLLPKTKVLKNEQTINLPNISIVHLNQKLEQKKYNSKSIENNNKNSPNMKNINELNLLMKEMERQKTYQEIIKNDNLNQIYQNKIRKNQEVQLNRK